MADGRVGSLLGYNNILDIPREIGKLVQLYELCDATLLPSPCSQANGLRRPSFSVFF